MKEKKLSVILKMMKFRVGSEIFEKFPGVRIGMLVVTDMDNTLGGKEIASLLSEEEKSKAKELAGAGIKTHPKVAPWREIYQQFGSKPNEFRSSIEALLRRVAAGNKLPSINPLVDLYNFISIKHLIPVGAEDLDKVKGDIILGFAKGSEVGKYIGSEEISNCYPGEVAYLDELGFICRRWNWREADRTKLMPESTNAVVVMEAVATVSEEELTNALKETANLIEKFLGAKVKIEILNSQSNILEINFEPGKKLTDKDLQGLSGGVGIKKLAFKKGKEELKPEELVKQKLFKVDCQSFPYRLAKLLYPAATTVVGKRGVKLHEIIFEHPANPQYGDYSTSIALKPKTKNQKPKIGFSSPLDLANAIVNAWRSQGLPDFVAKIEVAKPGFINIWLKNEVFISQLEEVIRKKQKFGSTSILKGKTILLEHTSPNPQTTIMLGHLRNNFLGMTTANLFEFLGTKVVKDCIINDRGVHLCRAIWGYLVFGQKRSGLKRAEILDFKKITDKKIESLIAKAGWQKLLENWQKKKSGWWQVGELGLKVDHANLIWYVLGSRAFKLEEKVKLQVEEILIAWEKEDKSVRQIWKRLLDWVEEGYGQTYKRVGSVHDWVWYESDFWKKGKEIVEKGLEKGIFKKSEGAIVTNLGEYGLTDTVVVKTDGTALYLTQDPALTQLKIKKFPSDLYIWDIGLEQTLHFKQLFSICELLGIGKKEDFFHLSYALINMKGGGKMATRTGDVIKADEILDLLHKRALEIIKSSNQELRGKLTPRRLDDLAEAVAVGAVKYSLLKFGRETTIYFDIDESLALEGNSGPYLQYTYARAQSVLQKAGISKSYFSIPNIVVSAEELAVIRTIYQFPEVVGQVAKNFAPNLLCNFLYDLAQKFNLFYNKWPILKAENEDLVKFRLAMTMAVGQVIKNGLTLLGISTPERM